MDSVDGSGFIQELVHPHTQASIAIHSLIDAGDEISLLLKKKLSASLSNEFHLLMERVYMLE